MVEKEFHGCSPCTFQKNHDCVCLNSHFLMQTWQLRPLTRPSQPALAPPRPVSTRPSRRVARCDAAARRHAPRRRGSGAFLPGPFLGDSSNSLSCCVESTSFQIFSARSRRACASTAIPAVALVRPSCNALTLDPGCRSERSAGVDRLPCWRGAMPGTRRPSFLAAEVPARSPNQVRGPETDSTIYIFIKLPSRSLTKVR